MSGSDTISDLSFLKGSGTLKIDIQWDAEPEKAPLAAVAPVVLHTSTDGRTFIEAFEGCDEAISGQPGKFITYYDSVGVLTLGYGHTNLGNIAPYIKVGDVWTQAQCDAALSNDLAKFEAAVTKIMSGFILVSYQFDALVSFDFNTGDLGSSSIPSRLKAGDVEGAMSILLEYDHAGGQELPGLTRRREAERLMYLGMVPQALALAGASMAEKTPMMKASRGFYEAAQS